MIGNHDVREQFLKAFPDHPVDKGGFIQHSHQTEWGVVLLIDTKRNGVGVHDGQLCQARLEWLRARLEDAKDRPVYVFMPYPLFDIGILYVDDIKLLDAEKFADTLSCAKNLKPFFIVICTG